MTSKTARDFPREVLDLFDGYIHGLLSRREFLDRAARYAVGGISAEDTAKIKAALLIHHAGRDRDTTAGWPAWKTAL